MKFSNYIVKALVASVALLVLGAQLGCQTTGTTGAGLTTSDDLPNITNTEYRPGDKIIIDFDNGLQTPWQQVVREDGSITLPLDKRVIAQGKRKAQLEEEIQRIYVPRFLARLTVNVRAEERTYFVQGEVRNPGQRPHTGLITAMKAIAAAGDFTDYAKKTDVEIIRANGEKIHMNGKKALRDPARYDVPVYPGDTVHVHRRFF